MSLKQRGLNGVELAVSDDHAGLRKAIAEILPEAAWQRCYVHFLREGISEKPRGNGTSVIVVGVSGCSVNYNQRACDQFLLCAERVSPIQQQTSGSPRNSQPLRAA